MYIYTSETNNGI